MNRSVATWGDDNDTAWNDRHFQHAYLWLTTNANSPYYGSPAMLLTAMGIDRSVWADFRRAFGRAHFGQYRFSVRVKMTKAFQRVLAGEFTPVVLKRNSLNRIIKYKILPSPDPVPLNCPAFYRGSIKLTTRGLQIALKSTSASLAPAHDPKGKERLLSPFGKV